MENKELEALEIIYNNIDYLTSDVVIENEEVNSCLATIQEQLPIIKQALTELKAIKEAQSSEALKCVDVLKEDGCITTLYQGKALETIRQYILKAQEQDKVLNRIIKHLSFEDSGIEVVKDFINDKKETKYIIKVISKDTGATIHIHLNTQEEFNTLKRYFGNE